MANHPNRSTFPGSEIIAAVDRSRSHNEIVYVDVPAVHIDRAVDLLADMTDEHDYVRNGDIVECWGWNDGQPEGKMDWRVHLREKK